LKLEGEAFIIYPKEKPLSPPAREFLDLLRRSRPKEKALEKSKSRRRSSKTPESLDTIFPQSL